MSETHLVNLKIVGDHTMHCAGCERTVDMTLSMVPGIESVQTNWETQMIEVETTSDSVDTELILEQLANIGYEAELLA